MGLAREGAERWTLRPGGGSIPRSSRRTRRRAAPPTPDATSRPLDDSRPMPDRSGAEGVEAPVPGRPEGVSAALPNSTCELRRGREPVLETNTSPAPARLRRVRRCAPRSPRLAIGDVNIAGVDAARISSPSSRTSSRIEHAAWIALPGRRRARSRAGRLTSTPRNATAAVEPCVGCSRTSGSNVPEPDRAVR